MSQDILLFLTVGFCGGFTTFSTFVNENFTMLQGGEVLNAVLYAGLSLAVGLLFLYLGAQLSRIF